MWKRCGRFWAVLLLFLLVSSLAYSEGLERVYYLTEAEFVQLKMVFAGLKTENEMLTQQLDELKKEAQGLKTESGTLKTQLAEVQTSLTKASESLRTYAADMNQALLTARTKTVIYAVIGFAAGGLAGYLIGAF